MDAFIRGKTNAQRVVVVGVDYSPQSEAALALACELAKGGVLPGEVHAVRALLDVEQCLDLDSETALLERICARYAARLPSAIVTHVSFDEPEMAIVGLARKENAALIVIGTRPRRWLQRLVTESLTERIVRTAPCPVVVTRAPDEAVVG